MWKQSLSNPHRANSFAVWGNSSMNMWLISWLEYFFYCICKRIRSTDVFRKAVSILSQSWCLSDRSTSLRTPNTVVQWDCFPNLYRDFSGSRTIWLTQGNSYIKKTFDLSVTGDHSQTFPVWEPPNSPSLCKETWVLTLGKSSCCRGPPLEWPAPDDSVFSILPIKEWEEILF